MSRLLKDAEKLTGKKFDLSSYADIVEAIHAIQENMGIAGTTAKEASNTIQGSFSAMKSSWTNFMTGMADPEQDFDQLVGNLIDSVVTFSKNLIPRIKGTVPRLAQGLVAIGKEIQPHIPPILQKIGEKVVEYVPKLGEKFRELILKAKDYLIANKGAIWDGFKEAVASGISLISEMFTGESLDVSAIKDKIQEITDKVISFVDYIKEHLPTIKGIIIGVAGVIGTLKLALFACNAVIAINETVTKAKAAADLVMAAKTKILNSAVWASVKAFGAQAMALLTNPMTWVVVGIVALIAAIILLVKNWDKVKEVAGKCWDKIKEIWGKVSQWFSENVTQPVVKFFSGLWDKVSTGAKNLWAGICSVFSKVGTWIYSNVISPVVSFFKGLGTVLFVVVAGIVGLVCQGFLKIAGWVNTHVVQPVVGFFKNLWERIKSIASSIAASIRSIWGTVSNWVNAKVVQPIVTFFVNFFTKAKQIVNNVSATIKAVWGLIASWVNSKVIQPVISFFGNLWSNLKKIVQNIWVSICNTWGKIAGWVNGKVISPLKDFFKGLWVNIKNIASNIKESIVNAFKSAWDKVTGVWRGLKDFFKGIWDGIKDTASSLKESLVSVFKTAVKGVAKPVNKLIGGANWVLEKLGSETRIAEWQPYAKGTKGHPGGNAIVNDGRGAELVQFPNGQTFIPKGRNVAIPNAPKGMKVLDAQRTAKVMGRSSPTFNYGGSTGNVNVSNHNSGTKAYTFVKSVLNRFRNTVRTTNTANTSKTSNTIWGGSEYTSAFNRATNHATTQNNTATYHYAGGIGDWAIWDFFDDAKGLVSKVIDKFVSYKDVSAYALDAGKAMVSKATWSMVDWVKSQFSKFGGKDLSSYVPSQGVEQWRSTVVQALNMEGLNTTDNVKRTLHQMQTESGGNPKAINNWDVNARKGTPSKGLMQVIEPTFKAYARSGYNKNIYDPLSNILASVRYARSRYGSLEQAYRGVGYAEGIGFPDMFMPLSLPAYSPTGTVVNSGSTTSTSTNNYSPSFTLNMSGTVDRTTKRTIQEWVREAIEETLESMSRSNPRITEI